MARRNVEPSFLLLFDEEKREVHHIMNELRRHSTAAQGCGVQAFPLDIENCTNQPRALHTETFLSFLQSSAGIHFVPIITGPRRAACRCSP